MQAALDGERHCDWNMRGVNTRPERPSQPHHPLPKSTLHTEPEQAEAFYARVDSWKSFRSRGGFGGGGKTRKRKAAAAATAAPAVGSQ